MSDAIPTSCPRCSSTLSDQEYYGICASCRDELRQRWSGNARDVTAAEYEPKMNVTPNAVATRD